MTNPTGARALPAGQPNQNPAQNPAVFLGQKDFVIIQKLRADNPTWRDDPIGPSVIQKTVNELYPQDKKCGPERAYRLQKRVQDAPEYLPEGEPLPARPLPEPEAPAVLVAPEPSAPILAPSVQAERPEPESEDDHAEKPEHAWPILVIALSAFVGLWAGWVGLGEMTGFGIVQPLPGITDWELNTSITLPLGVEILAAYAIRAWLSGFGSQKTRRFARKCALGCLLLGASGQVAYHLMKVNGVGANGAPWWVTTLVSVIPIASLGLASGLNHMLSVDQKAFRKRQKAQKP